MKRRSRGNKAMFVVITILLLLSDCGRAWGDMGGSWNKSGADWYYFDSPGSLDTGWKQIDGYRYFFYPGQGAGRGKMMTGWQWIDGHCYYFAEQSGNGYPQGAMYAAGRTPDGYPVNSLGEWTDAAGMSVYIAGKGILLPGTHSQGERGGGHGSGASAGTDEPKNSVSEGDKADVHRPSSPSDADEKEDIYTASPSEARRVNWNIYFVDADDHGHQILKSQRGQSQGGTDIVIDFPETLIGTDGYCYHAAVSSPLTITVNGDGEQKYYIEFEQGEKAETEDPDGPSKARLEEWIQTAQKADMEIMERESSLPQVITDTPQDSNDRLKNLISAVDNPKRHEIYLIGRGYLPNAVIIGETFLNIADISELPVDTITVDKEIYSVVRVGFRKIFEARTCTHKLEIVEKEPAGCLANGHETVVCGKCGWEETVILPAAGHEDKNKDGICDICYEEINGTELPEPVHYNIGDIQLRLIGAKTYLFRCIDEDYKDAMDNPRQTALFLCDTVIQSDIISSSGQTRKMWFGENNNYKYSQVRKWLNASAADKLFEGQTSYTGITLAYEGGSEKGTYDQFDEDTFTVHNKPFQLSEDKIFILSVEEAFQYRDYLWKFNGSIENNPQSQLSPYSKGYFLRTPQFAEGSGFRYGQGIYIVDLANGNIHPANVTDTSTGIRPAITVRQD